MAHAKKVDKHACSALKEAHIQIYNQGETHRYVSVIILEGETLLLGTSLNSHALMKAMI